MTNLIGQRLGQYELTALLGQGGMATVYRAHQASIRRDVAVKIIESQVSRSPDFVRRFEREAQTIAGLSHAHILKVFDYGQQGNLVYLVMELLTGGSLAETIRTSGAQATQRTLQILDQIASALDFAHQKGVIHRDLKPQNVLFDEAGNAFLTDFGIAKLLTSSTALTQSGAVMGTPTYMAPEQWRGVTIDSRADIYSLGVVLYEMLSGKTPFQANTPYAMMHKHIYEPPPPILEQRSDLPAAVEQVLQVALSKDREQRYQTAAELATAFKAAITGQPLPVISLRSIPPIDSGLVTNPRAAILPPIPSTTMPSVPVRPARRIWLGALIIGFLAVIGIGGILIVKFAFGSATPTPISTATLGIAVLPTQANSPTAVPTVTPTFAPSSTIRATALSTTTVPNVVVVQTTTAFTPIPPSRTLSLTNTSIPPSHTSTPPPTQTLDLQKTAAVLAITGTANRIASSTKTLTPSSTFTATPLPTRTFTATSIPPTTTFTATPIPTHTVTATPIPPTVTPTPTSTPVYIIITATLLPTRTLPPATPTLTATLTPIPPTPTPAGPPPISVSNAAQIKQIAQFKRSAFSLAWSPDSKIIAIANGFDLWLYDPNVPNADPRPVEHEVSLYNIAFSPDSKLIAGASADGRVRVWDLTNLKMIANLRSQSSVMYSVAFSPNGTLASGSSDGIIRLWDIASGKARTSISDNAAITAMAFGPDSTKLAYGLADGSVRLWDITTNKQRSFTNSPGLNVYSVAFSPDGSLVAAGSMDTTLRIWEAVSGTQRAIYNKGVEGAVLGVAFSPDSKLFATGSSDYKVRLWDVTSTTAVVVLSGHFNRVNSVAFSPDGSKLVSGGADGTIRIWSVQP